MATALWIAYLVPHRLRHRQQLFESRTEDRFSGALRVLAVTGRPGRDPRVSGARTDCGPGVERRAALLTPRRGIPVQDHGIVAVRKGWIVDRPHGTHDRISTEAAMRAAQRRAHRAASLARRGAAARRRGALTLALLALSVIGWIVVGLTTVAVVAAVAPTVALASVLALGRRAAVQGRAADVAWEHQQRATSGPGGTTAPATGRALHPSYAPTQISDSTTDPIVPSDGVEAGDAAEVVEATEPDAGAPASAEWSPVPVPRPTYTTKAAAPRREPIPLVISDESAVSSPVAPSQDVSGDDAATAADDAEVPRQARAGAPALAEGSATLDLDAILARRRAAG